MRFCPAVVLCVCLAGILAQTITAQTILAPAGDDPEVARAKIDIERLRSLVETGVLPRVRLEKAEAALEDARDAAFLRKTLYGQDLNAEQSDEMVAASTRRFERRKKAFDEAKTLVDAGVESQLSLAGLLDDLELARKECELARTRASLIQELAEMAKAEEALETKLAEEPSEAPKIGERFDGAGVFNTSTFTKVEEAFARQFGKPLPVSAMGDTAVHRALGFDHTGRVDVALSPDQEEGAWLLRYLTNNRIPYFAFRQAVPGKATGAHIHLGPVSTRFKLGG